MTESFNVLQMPISSHKFMQNANKQQIGSLIGFKPLYSFVYRFMNIHISTLRLNSLCVLFKISSGVHKVRLYYLLLCFKNLLANYLLGYDSL